jgi:cell division protein FtsW
VLLTLVAVLNLVGLAMVLSASSVNSLEDYGSPWYQFQRQLVWLVLAGGALALSLRVDYHRWRRWVGLALVVTGAMLVAVLVPGVGISVNGSTRWLGAGPLQIQPSELAKLALVLFTADLLARRAHRVHDSQLTLRPVLTVFAVFAGLILLQPNLGTTMIIFVVLWIMLFVSGVELRKLVLTLGVVAAGAAALAVLEPYRMRRLTAFANPWADPQNTGYQTIQSQVGLANGGITGTGLGQGRAKWGFLPEAHTDFIFTIIGEEVGLIGALLVVAMFLAVGVLGIRVAMRAPDRFGMLLATGITAWFLVQAFVNIAAAVGMAPITGVPLPFVSSGGSSLVVNMAAMGVLANVARQTP